MKVLYPRSSDEEQVSWSEDLRKLCVEATKELVIVSPWIKKAALQYVLPKEIKNLTIRVLTRANAYDFLLGPSDLDAIRYLRSMDAEIRLIQNLHAKVYIADGRRAIITSGNLTLAGFDGNAELGMLVDSEDEVAHMLAVVNGWFDKAQKVSVGEQWLTSMTQDVERLREEYRKLNLPTSELPTPNRELRGEPLSPPKSKSSNRKTEAREQLTNEEGADPARIISKLSSSGGSGKEKHYIYSPASDWRAEISEWGFTKYTRTGGSFVRFFTKAFKPLEDFENQAVRFGRYGSFISLTGGVYTLAQISERTYRISLVVANENPSPELIPAIEPVTCVAKSGIWCVQYYLRDIAELLKSKIVWDSYEAAISTLRPMLMNWQGKVLHNDRRSLREWLATRGIDE
jgi:hypothetical protein